MTNIDLKESVRRWILDNVPYDRTNLALCAELEAKDAHGLLVVYGNWLSRRVRPTSRKVEGSSAFRANPIVRERAADIAVIIDDIEKGRDLTRYLSRGINYVIDSAVKPLKKRRDLDLMLNDWGVHHLHISTELKSDGHVRPDNPLLFAKFTNEAAYLIDVMQHGDWTRQHIVKVIIDEWPDAGLVNEIRGVLGLANKRTEEEHQELREVGINVMVEIGGRVYMPGGGMVATGIAVAASRAADQLIITLEKFEAIIRDQPSRIEAAFAQHGTALPENPNFVFCFLDPQGYGVLETVTGTLIALG